MLKQTVDTTYKTVHCFDQTEQAIMLKKKKKNSLTVQLYLY